MECERPSPRKPSGVRATEAGYRRHYAVGEKPCSECREAHRLEAERYRMRKPERSSRSIERHGITEDEYRQRVSEQGGVCAVCGHPPKEGKRLEVDHDHGCCDQLRSCGVCIRGLVCHRCNSRIGMVEAGLRRATAGEGEYLRRWRHGG